MNLCLITFLWQKKRLQSFVNNLVKKDLMQRYDTEITKLSDKNHAEKAPDIDLCSADGIWYLPHHGVITDKKPEKLVFLLF